MHSVLVDTHPLHGMPRCALHLTFFELHRRHATRLRSSWPKTALGADLLMDMFFSLEINEVLESCECSEKMPKSPRNEAEGQWII